MKKLMFSVSAALVAGGAWAGATAWIYNESTDLATRFNAIGLDQVFEVGANNGSTVSSTLGSDVSINAYSFAVMSGTTFNLNLGGHTLTDKDPGLMFYFTAGPNALNVSNGTIYGSQGGELRLHADGAPVLNATFNGVTFKDYTSVNLGAQDGFSDSTITFKGGSKLETSGTLVCTTAKSEADNYNTVRFEGGTKVTCNGFTTMTSGYALSKWNNQVVVAGEGTSVSNSGGLSFQDAGGASLTIDDHASFFCNAWPNLGLGKGYCSVTVANGATFTTHDFFIGANNADYPSQHNTLTVKDATIKVPNWDYSSYDHLFVGKYSDNNTLVLSNADASACAGIWVGGSYLDPSSTDPEKVKATSGNAVYIYGSTKLPSSGGKATSIESQWPSFYSCDGLVCFNGFKDTTSWTASQLTIPTGNQVQDRDRNEIRFENGSDIALNNIHIPYHIGTKITIKNSILRVKEQFVDYGLQTVLELDNGVMTLDGETCENLFFNQNEDMGGDATCIFKGDHPQILNKTVTGTHKNWETGEILEGPGQFNFTSRTGEEGMMTIRIYLPDEAKYKNTLIVSPIIYMSGVKAIDIPNLAEVRESIVGTADVPLAEASKILYVPNMDTMSLPEGCSLVRSSGADGDPGTLYLRIQGEGTAKPGAVLIIK